LFGNLEGDQVNGFLKVKERNAKHAKNTKISFFLGVLCALRVEKMTKHRFTMDFEKTMQTGKAKPSQGFSIENVTIVT
jgi:uncharacterized protein YlaI